MTTIKQLEWNYSSFHGGEQWVATPIPSHLKYVIVKDTPPVDLEFVTHIDEKYAIYINTDLKELTDGLVEAKHIAQADFEDKIGACLNDQHS